jgi:hypothetical protein
MKVTGAHKMLAAAAIATAAMGSIYVVTGVGAFPNTVSTSTNITNHPDSGDGGTWAYDDFTRALTIGSDNSTADCHGLAGFTGGTDKCYSAVVTDNGEFNAIVGALAPNQSTAGVKITHAVQGSMTGQAQYFLYAPASDTPNAANVELIQDDAFTSPVITDHTTGDWPAQAFTDPTSVVIAYADSGNAWSWSYKTQCESWTDSGTNGDGDLAGDGNITGASCAPVIKPAPPHHQYRKPAPVQDFTINRWASTSHSVELVWHPDQFTVFYTVTITQLSRHGHVTTRNATAPDVMITGLQPSTQYEASITATGPGGTSNPVSITFNTR